MTAKRMCRTMALTTVLLTAGLASSGCGREEERLTAPVVPMASLSSSSLPGSYSWGLTWNGSSISAGATWYWQLVDSSWVLGGQASGGGAVSGTGTVPLDAIAVKAIGGVYHSSECSAYDSVSKALNNQQGVSITLGAQVPSFSILYNPLTGTSIKTKCPSGSFSFSLHA